MPKLYEYLGIIVFFFTKEHEPIHVHGKYNGKETKAEIHLSSGRVQKIVLKDKGPGLDPKKRKEFEEFVSAHATEIVQKWVDYFVMKKHVAPKVINQKVKKVANVRTIR